MKVDVNNILESIDDTLAQRKSADARSSYVASLYQNGTPAILKKVAEESEEVVMAAAESDERLVYEVADLVFHCQVLLAHKGLNMHAVLLELARRFGSSGYEVQKERAMAQLNKDTKDAKKE